MPTEYDYDKECREIDEAEQQHYERLADEDHDRKLKEKFNLSDKIVEIEGGRAIHPDDVKEFIKILLEELTDITKPIHKRDVQQIICKYAGKDLL